MAFRKDAWATVWSIEDGKNGSKRVRISTNRKNKVTNEFEQDFSGFCNFFGTAAQKAATLKPKDRIKLGDVEVTTWYDSANKKEYVNYKVFDYELSFDSGNGNRQSNKSGGEAPGSPYEGDSNIEEELPF